VPVTGPPASTRPTNPTASRAYTGDSSSIASATRIGYVTSTASWARMSPSSYPALASSAVAPICGSPLTRHDTSGANPRYRGSSESWMTANRSVPRISQRQPTARQYPSGSGPANPVRSTYGMAYLAARSRISAA